MANIVLIQPPIPTPNKLHNRESQLSAPPIALGYLASMLVGEGYKVVILDMDILELNASDLEEQLAVHQPRLVGISAMTLTYRNALRIARRVKAVDPTIVTVLGGPHVTFTATETLAEEPLVDYVIRGEGEVALLWLVRQVIDGPQKIVSVPGLSFRAANGQIVHNRRSPLLRDLDNLPFPSRHLLPLDLYSAPGLIITGRGCEGRCIFCAARGIAGGRYRMRSVDNILDEIEIMRSLFGITFLFFGDDTFTADPARVQRLCESLYERHLDISWICETRCDTVDLATLTAMAEAGCRVVQFGAESGSQQILDTIGKGIALDQLRQAVRDAVAVGLQPTCSFMLPHPNDTRETITQTSVFIRELQDLGARTAVSLTTPFPGTYLSHHLKDLGLTLICEDTDWYNFATPVIETRAFDYWDIRELYMDTVMLCLTGAGVNTQEVSSSVH